MHCVHVYVINICQDGKLRNLGSGLFSSDLYLTETLSLKQMIAHQYGEKQSMQNKRKENIKQ